MKKIIIVIIIITSNINLFSQNNFKNQAFEIGIESIDSFRDFLAIKNDANYKNPASPPRTG